MKKLLTLFATLAIAFTLSMPAFSQEAPAGDAAAQSAPAKKESKKKHSSKKKEKKASKKKKETSEPQGQ